MRFVGGGILQSEMLFHSLMGGGNLEYSATIIGLTDLNHVFFQRWNDNPKDMMTIKRIISSHFSIHLYRENPFSHSTRKLPLLQHIHNNNKHTTQHTEYTLPSRSNNTS